MIGIKKKLTKYDLNKNREKRYILQSGPAPLKSPHYRRSVCAPAGNAFLWLTPFAAKLKKIT